jgi:Fe-S cluster assembly scaffold protein SufB
MPRTLLGRALPTTHPEEWRYSRVRHLDTEALVPTALRLTGFVPAAGIDAPDPCDVFIECARMQSTLRFPIDSPVGCIESDGAGGFAGASIHVDVPAGEERTAVIEVALNGDGSLGAVELIASVPADSRLNLVVLQRSGDTHVVLALNSEVAENAELDLTYIGLGGTYSRMRSDTVLSGEGARAHLRAAYLGMGSQMHDLRTFQRHLAPRTSSVLDFRGAVGDEAEAVYTGLITVGNEARGTDASQSNRIIKLSDQAWAYSVPNLEINHNDVRCAHASSVGPIDDAQRFYLESRGVAPEVAAQLIVSGHFADVIEQSATPDRNREVQALIAERLGAPMIHRTRQEAS